MDKAKVLEIIEPSSDLEGKIPISSFDPRKIRTDSLDDADDFPEKEVCTFLNYNIVIILHNKLFYFVLKYFLF